MQGANRVSREFPEKTGILAGHFLVVNESAFDDNSDEELDAQLNTNLRILLKLEGEILVQTNPEKTERYIGLFKPEKASEHNCISESVLKELCSTYINYLVHIVNTILCRHFPNTCKDTIVVPILSHPLFLQNHKPISLISCFIKPVKALILTWLKEEIFVHQLIQNEQLSFRDGLSTEFQLFLLTEAIREALQRKESPDVIFLNIDTVWCKDLINQMIGININPNIIRNSNFIAEPSL